MERHGSACKYDNVVSSLIGNWVEEDLAQYLCGDMQHSQVSVDQVSETLAQIHDRRLRKRCAIIARIKTQDDYELVQECWHAKLLDTVPSLPDPYLVDFCSKREWEKNIMEYRRSLKYTYNIALAKKLVANIVLMVLVR